MLRDVFDPAVVEQEKLGEEFASKFQGKAKEWTRAVGVSEDLMRKYWEAHYDYPSNTQLYEMVHRLRPGRVGADLQVTQADAGRILAINDVAPKWRDRLLAISYRPLTRTDAKRAFMIGRLTAAELTEVYQDQGYTREDAEKLVDFAKIERRKAIKSTQWVALYRRGGLHVSSAVQELQRMGFEFSAIEEALREVDIEEKGKTQITCIKAIRRRFFVAELSSEQARDALVNLGVDATLADNFARSWSCELASKSKVATAAKICKWLEEGLITPAVAASRYTRLGFSAADAESMLRECQLGIGRRAAARAMKEAKEAEARLTRAAKTEEQIRKQLEAAARAREGLRLKRISAAELESTRRAEAIAILSPKLAVAVPDLHARLAVLAAGMRSALRLSGPIAWRAIGIAAERFRGSDIAEFEQFARDLSTTEAAEIARELEETEG
jgi:hypothetical protein